MVYPNPERRNGLSFRRQRRGAFFARPGIAALVVFLLGLHAAASAGAAEPAAKLDSAPLRVMSFNVRNSSAHDGANAWDKRREFFFNVIGRFQPTLIGFQEVLADQFDDITHRLADYAFAGVAREDGLRKGEWALIGYRKDRFESRAEGNFWLSEQPEVPGSKSWDAAYTRICSWVRLRDKSTGREFIYANTHFDNKGKIARLNSSRLLSTRLAALAHGMPIVLTGDFNASEDDPALQLLMRATGPDPIHWVDSYREVHPQRSPDEASFHGFKGNLNGSRIDFILHSADFTATAAEIDRSRSDAGLWPSDHYAVTALLQWH